MDAQTRRDMIQTQERLLALAKQVNKLTLIANNQRTVICAQTELLKEHSQVIAALDLKDYLATVTDTNVIDFIQKLEEKKGGLNND